MSIEAAPNCIQSGAETEFVEQGPRLEDWRDNRSRIHGLAKSRHESLPEYLRAADCF